MNIRTANGATISSCKTFRYVLWRQWDARLPTLVFIMLNPSTADDGADDPTIRKCVGFARRADFGSIIVLNLFAYRATDPRNLVETGYQIGPENDDHLRSMLLDSAVGNKVVCAWGAHGTKHSLMQKRVGQVLAMARELDVPLHVLGTTASGAPRHPLMLGYDNNALISWAPWEVAP